MIPEECIKARVTCNAVCTCGWFIHTSWLHVQSNQDTSSKECLWRLSEYWWHGPQWRHNFGGISTWWQHCLWYHLLSVVRNNDPWVVVTPVKCFTEQEMVIPKARYLELGHWTIYSRCRCGVGVAYCVTLYTIVSWKSVSYVHLFCCVLASCIQPTCILVWWSQTLTRAHVEEGLE